MGLGVILFLVEAMDGAHGVVVVEADHGRVDLPRIVLQVRVRTVLVHVVELVLHTAGTPEGQYDYQKPLHRRG